MTRLELGFGFRLALDLRFGFELAVAGFKVQVKNRFLQFGIGLVSVRPTTRVRVQVSVSYY